MLGWHSTYSRNLLPALNLIGDVELAWLRFLASEETVADLAKRIGYSEREMYRRLRRLYSRVGASGRMGALLRVAPLGSAGLIGACPTDGPSPPSSTSRRKNTRIDTCPGSSPHEHLACDGGTGTNPDALGEIEALPRTVVGADGYTVREESAGSPRKGTN